jgi:hypothetical protein
LRDDFGLKNVEQELWQRSQNLAYVTKNSSTHPKPKLTHAYIFAQGDYISGKETAGLAFLSGHSKLRQGEKHEPGGMDGWMDGTG